MRILILTYPAESHVKLFLHLFYALGETYSTTIYMKDSFENLFRGCKADMHIYESSYIKTFENAVLQENLNQIYNNDMEAIERYEFNHLYVWRKNIVFIHNYLHDANLYDLIIYDYFMDLGYYLSKKFRKKSISLFPMLFPFSSPSNSKINDLLSMNYIGNGYDNNHISLATNKINEMSKRISECCKYQFDFFSKGISEYNIIASSPIMYPYVVDPQMKKCVYFMGSALTEKQPDIMRADKNKRILVNLGTVWSEWSVSLWISVLDQLRDTEYIVDAAIRNLDEWIDMKVYDSSVNINCCTHIPFDEYMSQADLYICHGGLASINEALNYEVPMIVIPTSGERQINALKIEKLGAGIFLPPNLSTVCEQLLTAVESVLNEKPFRENCKQIKNTLLDCSAQTNIIIDKIKQMEG